ncbi:hypothetical protein [Pinibacter soli]|uniref:Uncharacterized protein n=1 Tax=Pinibacter soli TaxID=3044211 RepID=A0ABT6R979_9BACT|nr:hypothetical protein [Pinibacter soli]MDI3319115.1 hypothetical protein [Pinibacter soli]
MKNLIIQMPMKLALWCGQGLWDNRDYLPEARSLDASILNTQYSESENISIEMRPNTIIDIYKRISNLPVGVSAAINSDAKNNLLPQLIAFAQGTDAELAESAAHVLTILQEWDEKQQQDAEAIITNLVSQLFTS